MALKYRFTLNLKDVSNLRSVFLKQNYPLRHSSKSGSHIRLCIQQYYWTTFPAGIVQGSAKDGGDKERAFLGEFTFPPPLFSAERNWH